MSSRRSVAVEYHRLTKYDEENVRTLPRLDPSRQPPQTKEIVGSRRVALRAHLPFASAGGEVRERPAVEGFGLPQLSRLLFFTNGVTGFLSFPNGGRQILRAAPSAGALYPTEIYAAIGNVPGVEPGLYNYQVASHELVHLWEGDQLGEIRRACGGDPALDAVECFLVFTGIFWRSAWRYRERGYRRVLLDTGHALANLAAYAPHEGVSAPPRLGFHDAALNGLFFFDDGVEAALACVPLAAAAAPGPLWASDTVPAVDVLARALESQEELPSSAGIALHRASCCFEPRPAHPPARAAAAGDGAIPLDAAGRLEERVASAILNRRSARSYSARSIPLEPLGRALGYAFGHGAAGHGRAATRDDGLMRAHLAVIDVDGLDPGIYAVEGRGESLRPVARGDYRARMHRLALAQAITESCAAILVLSARSRAALGCYGERGYRYLHVEAGAVGERFQLAATALGVAACGVGGFFDDEVANVVGLTPDDWVLYMVTIGAD